MRALQGTVPVVSLSFARSKGETSEETLASVKRVLRVATDAHAYLRTSENIATEIVPSLRKYQVTWITLSLRTASASCAPCCTSTGDSHRCN